MNFLTNNKSPKGKNETILQRISAGDQEGVRECLEQYRGLVWYLAEKFIGISAETEDAVQEIFIAIWQNAGHFNPEKGKEATFVSLIARRRLIDFLRRKTRKPETQYLDENTARCPINSEKQMQIRLEAERANRVLNQFHFKQRKVLNMAIYGGFTHMEIADEMEMPIGTVKSLIHRGYKKIRQRLEQNTYSQIAAV